jgi:hypothetical protein
MRGYWRLAGAPRPGDSGAQISSSDNGAPSASSKVMVRNWHISDMDGLAVAARAADYGRCRCWRDGRQRPECSWIVARCALGGGHWEVGDAERGEFIAGARGRLCGA